MSLSTRRSIRRLLLGAMCTLAACSHLAWAQDFPNRPVKLVVPFPAGGSVDAMARMIAESAGKSLGQPVVVENRPGASTLLATQYVSQAAPDGHTLMITTTALVINALVYPKANYDPVKSFAPVAHLVNGAGLWVANAGAPGGGDAVKLLQHFQSRPGELSVGTWGPASNTDIYAAMIQDATKVQLNRIYYKGEAPTLQDTLSGTLITSFITIGSYKAHEAGGKLRPLALTGPARSPALPDVPTFNEIGIPGPAVSGYVGILAPAGTPPAAIEKLSSAIRQALRQPELARKIETDWAFEMVNAGPKDFAAALSKDIPRWERTIKAFQIRAE